MKKIGELSTENELLRKRLKAKESLRQRRPQEMSAAISPSNGRPYGALRICSAWCTPRPSFYVHICPSSCSYSDNPTPERRKTSPKTELSDYEQHSLIREDLESSPFCAEGHRKKRARLKYVRGIPVSRKRVLRFMREANLLTPNCTPQMPPYEHTRRFVTDDPNVMSEGDGACFTAHEPMAQGILAEFGSVESGAARGVNLHMDHGSQHPSSHFQKQIRAWGMVPSFDVLEQP